MKLNNKVYKIPDFTFRTIVQLEEYGLNTFQIYASPLTLLSASIAIGNNITMDEAIDIVEEHIESGGSLVEPISEITNRISESSFFQNAMNQAEGKTEGKAKKTQVKKSTNKV